MTDASRGWAVGDGGTIIRTTDGGATWTACTSPTSASLYDVEFVRGTTTGWAVGASGTVVKTTDGVNWSLVGNGVTPDTTPPPAPSGVMATALSSSSVKVAWTAVTDPSGIKHYTVTNKTTGKSYTVATGTTYTVTGLTGNTSYTFYVTATDKADNTSARSAEKTAKTPVTVTPIAGADRIETAILASKKAFPQGAPVVVVATAYNWPDALGGSALAGAYGGPILLTPKDKLPDAVRDEVVRLKAAKVFVLGGTASVSKAVADALDALPGVTVKRLGGRDRYETARLVAGEAVAKLKGTGAWSGTAFVATGAKFPDALGASPLAAAKGWPIFLLDPRAGADDALVSAMKAAGVTRALVLGDDKAVPEAARRAIASKVGCATERISGADRYETAAKVAAYGVAQAGLSFDRVALATGENFPDALAGGVLQGKDGSVLLLTPTKKLASATASALSANKAAIHEVRFLGGPTAVSDAVRAKVLQALK
jgi:putative cell wall-binding protein